MVHGAFVGCIRTRDKLPPDISSLFSLAAKRKRAVREISFRRLAASHFLATSHAKTRLRREVLSSAERARILFARHHSLPRIALPGNLDVIFDNASSRDVRFPPAKCRRVTKWGAVPGFFFPTLIRMIIFRVPSRCEVKTRTGELTWESWISPIRFASLFLAERPTVFKCFAKKISDVTVCPRRGQPAASIMI